MKVIYAVLAYNNTIPSVTKLTPFEILTGHINSNSILNVDLETQITTNYITNDKRKTNILYKHIRDRNEQTKQKTLETRNKTREEAPEIPQEVYVRNKQKMNKQGQIQIGNRTDS